jgi:hypothetical protein
VVVFLQESNPQVSSLSQGWTNRVKKSDEGTSNRLADPAMPDP